MVTSSNKSEIPAAESASKITKQNLIEHTARTSVAEHFTRPEDRILRELDLPHTGSPAPSSEFTATDETDSSGAPPTLLLSPELSIEEYEAIIVDCSNQLANEASERFQLLLRGAGSNKLSEFAHRIKELRNKKEEAELGRDWLQNKGKKLAECAEEKKDKAELAEEKHEAKQTQDELEQDEPNEYLLGADKGLDKLSLGARDSCE